MQLTTIEGKFRAGTIVRSPEVTPEEVFVLLIRHVSGDWGDLNEHDWKLNEAALKHGGRLISQYGTNNGRVIWIITEADRSVTTILVPAVY